MRKFTHNGIKAIEMSIKKINLAEQSVIFFSFIGSYSGISESQPMEDISAHEKNKK